MPDIEFMRLALRLARRGYGRTSPNPLVGAVLVRNGEVIGQGWHCRAGAPHAEIEALHDTERRGEHPEGATLYVTLEPCSTQGRTPPCTDAIRAARIKRVVVAAIDPNPRHAGRGIHILRRHGIKVDRGVLGEEAAELNEAYNHWVVRRTPFVTVKAAMSLDGKIASAGGESKWITGGISRAAAMKLRQGADAILVGINTILADDPRLTIRTRLTDGRRQTGKPFHRIILDSRARIPLWARVIADDQKARTIIVVGRSAPKRRVAALARRANVWVAPSCDGKIDLRRLLKRLGAEGVSSLLVEGGGEVNASFLLGGFSHRIVFFYAPIILGGRDSKKAAGGNGARRLEELLRLREGRWRRLGPDLLLTARTGPREPIRSQAERRRAACR